METDKLKKMKDTAEFLMDNNIPAFIKDIYDTWYFGYIVLVGDLRITIDNTEGKREGLRDNLIWSNIEYIDEKKGVVRK